MKIKQLVGYTLAAFHSIFSWGMLLTAILTQNMALLLVILIIEIATILSWRLFDNKCILTVIESKFLEDVSPEVKNGEISYFNHYMSRYFSKDTIATTQVVRPSISIFVSLIKLAGLL